MNVFTCDVSFNTNGTDVVVCSTGVFLTEIHTLTSGQHVFSCDSFDVTSNKSKCYSGFLDQVITDTQGDTFTFIASEEVLSLTNKISTNSYQQITVKQENMVTINNLGVYEIGLITGATVSILLLAFVFRVIRKMIWY